MDRRETMNTKNSIPKFMTMQRGAIFGFCALVALGLLWVVAQQGNDNEQESLCEWRLIDDAVSGDTDYYYNSCSGVLYVIRSDCTEQARSGCAHYEYELEQIYP